MLYTPNTILNMMVNMSQSVKAKKQVYKRSVQIATPNARIDVINKVVTVLFNYRRPAMYKELAIASNLHPSSVSQALSASRDMGLTTSGGKKGLYVLTDRGKEYARFQTVGREKEAKLILRELLQEQPRWKEIMVFLKVIRGEARDPLDLVIDIERKLNRSWSPSGRSNYRECLVSILAYAGLIEVQGGKIFSLLGEEEEPEEEVSPAVVALPTEIPSDFALLQTDDFRFEVRKDVNAVDFAKSQFLAWIDYLKQRLADEENP